MPRLRPPLRLGSRGPSGHRPMRAPRVIVGPGRGIKVGIRILAATLGASLGLVALTAGSASAAEHTVRVGENLTTIARRYGVSTADLARINHLEDPNHVLVGMTLEVPSSVTRRGAAHRLPSGSSRSSSSSRTGPAGGSPFFSLLPRERQRVSTELSRAAAEFGVSPSLLKALTYTESRWRQDVVSANGATGVGQLLPSTARWLAHLMGEPDLDPTVRRDNIRMSAYLLAYLLDRTHSRRAALASYYQGLSAVLRSGISTGGARYASVISMRRLWFS